MSDIRELQAYLLGIYKEFKRICDIHDIPYFALGGTAIGAVRHAGFIPWDDDIDLMLLRADYLRFKQVLGTERSNAAYELFDPQDDPLYHKPLPSFADTRTLYLDNILRHQRPGKYHCLSLDVFILENVPNDLPSYHRYMREMWFRTKLFYIALTPRPNIPTKYAKFAWILRVVLFCAHYLLAAPPLRRALGRSLNKAYQRYFGLTEYYELIATPPVEEYRFSKDALFPAQLLPFEDTVMPVAHDNDAYLKQVHGDYMQPPPLEQRKTHPAYRLELPLGQP